MSKLTDGQRRGVVVLGIVIFAFWHGCSHSSTSSAPSTTPASSTSTATAAAPQSTETPIVTLQPSPVSDKDRAFLAAIAGDGITINDDNVVLLGNTVCVTLDMPGQSIWSVTQQVEQMRGWTVVPATHFVDRAIQNLCPDHTPTP
ncbi:DUF732 domain-containing protein [Mycolicibacterium aubagnense]|uniref:DUF732 domain-containing protein n=1 Tax=Mycolicibacterium aubagnense TaxID=319707 RepID=A0ABM7IBJ8_9MYCO|nr:DUF732 domain-containing protein [Mycolicibacterium aubagnense]WGI34108.1 DUF732 domain-containing protein [Mycolicibacterium aubagnense]BBX84089.1 hypothetical protein MAUB_19620 [Mycolicibacterium aubagnense]